MQLPQNRAYQMLLAMSQEAILLPKRGFKVAASNI
jgi:hypothetical protein